MTGSNVNQLLLNIHDPGTRNANLSINKTSWMERASYYYTGGNDTKVQ